LRHYLGVLFVLAVGSSSCALSGEPKEGKAKTEPTTQETIDALRKENAELKIMLSTMRRQRVATDNARARGTTQLVATEGTHPVPPGEYLDDLLASEHGRVADADRALKSARETEKLKYLNSKEVKDAREGIERCRGEAGRDSAYRPELA